METLHSEGDSPFTVKEDHASDSAGTGDDPQYVECPIEGCGELLLLQELDYHLELHGEESGHSHLEEASVSQPPGHDAHVAPSASGPPRSHREPERQRWPDHGAQTTSRQAKAISTWRRLLRMPSSSSAHKLLPKKRHHDETQTAGAHPTRGKRLGVSRVCSRNRRRHWPAPIDNPSRNPTSESMPTKSACPTGW